ncbi:MAG: hypothetical protein IIA65_02005 [Planctomycetes bacterium]|nr:hypothetical protein [Planctomycetota bacterium]
MTNRQLLLPGLILSLLVLGCSKKSEPGGEGADSNGVRPERRFLSIGTAPPGGAFFVVGSAIAEVIGVHTKSLGWQVSAEATKGTQENLRRLDSMEIDLALANAAISFASSRPCGPTQQFAHPLLATTPRTDPSATRCRLSVTEGDTTLLVLKVPATAVGRSDRSMQRSSASSSCVFRPA